jgi:hypothetical protein
MTVVLRRYLTNSYAILCHKSVVQGNIDKSQAGVAPAVVIVKKLCFLAME